MKGYRNFYVNQTVVKFQPFKSLHTHYLLYRLITKFSILHYPEDCPGDNTKYKVSNTDVLTYFTKLLCF